jgi:hypothetical protein
VQVHEVGKHAGLPFISLEDVNVRHVRVSPPPWRT